MNIVVTGSIAFDYLMSFPGRFTEHILPEHMNRLSLSFLVDTMDKRRGGCGPNIAYTLALLGERPYLMGTAGQDFGEYRQWLDAAGVAGLWAQMSDIAFNRYQSERQELEVADLNRLVARAIREIAASQPERNQWSFSSSTIAETIKRMIEDEEIDFGTDRLGARSIGRKIGKLRLKKDPTARPRQWLISKRVLDRVLSANRLPSLLQQETLPASLSNGVDGVDGVDGVNNAISSNNTIIPDGSESEKTAISEPEALKEGYL